MTRILYHVTRTRNLPRIMQHGLLPRIGRRARQLGEGRPAIYFFPDIGTAEDGIANWLGDQFADDTQLALLEITIPPGIEIHSDAGYERHVYEAIPPSAITVLKRNW